MRPVAFALAAVLTAGAAVVAGCAGTSGAVREQPLSPVVPPTTPPAPQINPFAGARLYHNPDYVQAVQALEPKHPAEAALFAAFLGLQLWLGFRGNAMTARAYRARGWVADNPRDPAVRLALEKWGLG